MHIIIKLNYQLNAHFNPFLPVIICIHGLFGNLSNFNTIAQALNKFGYNTLQIDLRNHGKSPHTSAMNYTIMAQDIFCLLDYLHITKCILIGHSMGGKVAMTLPMLKIKNSIKIIKMIIIDIAPITYTKNNHSNVFLAINHVTKSSVTTRNKAFFLMSKFINDPKIIFFC